MQLSDNDLNGHPTRTLPGSAPQPADPFGARSPYAATLSSLDLISRSHSDHDAAVAAAGHPVPAQVADLLAAAQQAIAKTPAIARQRILEAESYSSDDRLADAGKSRLIGEAADAAASQLADLQRAAAINLTQARAELEVAALPKLDPTREAFSRQDVGMRLDGVAAGDRPRLLMELARGNDQAAALVCGPFGLNALKAAGLSGRQLDDAHRGIIAAATGSAATSGDASREAAAAHLATVDRLASSADLIGHVARKSRSEVLARHGLPDRSAIKPNAAAMRGR